MEHLWSEGTGRLSTQVLIEYYATVTRKLQPRRPVDASRAEVREFLAWKPVVVDERILDAAWPIEDRYGISFWDSLIVAAAKASGCGTLLTEDLGEGGDYDGVRVVNPFTTAPS